MSESASGDVRCPGCGKVYRWRPEFAGRKARCKECSAVVVMPTERPGAAATKEPDTVPLDLPSDRCPSCGSSIKAGAVICVACGFNIKEGKHIETDVGDDAGPKKGLLKRFFGRKKT